MKFAYADPPYLGTAARTYGKIHPEAAAYDDPETHRRLFERLADEFPDGWALSLNEPSLRTLLPMAPAGVRVGCWISQRPKFPPSATIGRHWEPVIWHGGRKGPRRARDFVLTIHGGAVRSETERVGERATAGKMDARYHRRVREERFTFGAKPREFCFWIFELLGARAGDELCDLFPGSGAVASAWAEFTGGEPELPLTPLEALAKHQD